MKTNLWKFAAILAVGFAAITACDEPTPSVDPSFPNLVQNNFVGAGEVLTIEFDANYDWEIEVADESAAYFQLLDGEQKVSRISGRAGNQQVVSIEVTNLASDDRSYVGEIYMTMNGQTKMIALYTLPAKGSVVYMYEAMWSEEWNEYDSNQDNTISLTYAYLTNQISSLRIIRPGYNVVENRIKLEASFEWILEKPEWLTLIMPNDGDYGKEGVFEVRFSVDNSSYPVSGSTAEDKLIFKKKDGTVVGEYQIILPPDPISFELYSYISAPLTFSHQSKLKTASSGYTDNSEPFIALTSTKNARVIAVEKKGNVWAEASWVEIIISEWDSTDGDGGLQERMVTINVDENDGDTRKAIVFFLPENVTVSISDMFDANGIKAEYVDYSLPLTQVTLDYITFADPSADTPSFAIIEKVTATHENSSLLTEFDSKCVYKLTYADMYDPFATTFTLLESYSVCEVLNHSKQVVSSEEAANFWVSSIQDEWSGSYCINMDFKNIPEQPEAYVVYKNEAGTVLGVIYVLKGEKPVGSLVGDGAMYFGKYDSSSIVELTSGDLTTSYNCPIWHITYAGSMSFNSAPYIIVPDYDSYEIIPTSPATSEMFIVEKTAEGEIATKVTFGDSVDNAAEGLVVFKNEGSPVFVLKATLQPWWY